MTEQERQDAVAKFMATKKVTVCKAGSASNTATSKADFAKVANRKARAVANQESWDGNKNG